MRKAGLELGITRFILCGVSPFPGPGLAVRIIGAILREEKVSHFTGMLTLIFREEIAKAGLDRDIHQYFAVLTNMRSVGVMGDGRTYDYTPSSPRRNHPQDFMTADWARIPYDVLEKVSSRIINEVKSINRICLRHYPSKPPATIEWE